MANTKSKTASKYTWQMMGLQYSNPVQFADDYLKTAISNCSNAIKETAEKLAGARLAKQSLLTHIPEVSTYVNKLSLQLLQHQENLYRLLCKIEPITQSNFEEIQQTLIDV